MHGNMNLKVELSDYLNLKMKAVSPFETSLTTCQVEMT
jgi:hypothetical protein